MEMKESIKLTIFTILLSILFNVSAFSRENSVNYVTLHHDIQIAMDEMDYKKAKSLVESLLTILDSDIEYTESIIEDEDDEYFVNNLTTKLNRQQEIRKMLNDFLGAKKKDLLEFESLNTIRELRRLSIKPKER